MACGARARRRDTEPCTFRPGHPGFHSWDRRGKFWTRGAILDAGRLWIERHGVPPRFKDWRPPPEGYPTTGVVVWRFGTFGEYLRDLGATPRCGNPYCDNRRARDGYPLRKHQDDGPVECGRCSCYRREYGRQWKPEGPRLAEKRAEITRAAREAVRAFNAEYGHPPSAREWIDTGQQPSRHKIMRWYPSWATVLRDAGFEPRLRSREG